MWWWSLSRPPHLAIPEPVSIVFLLVVHEQLAGMAGHFSCLWTRAVSRDDQALPGSTWHLCYPLGKGQNYVVWGTPKLPYCRQEFLQTARMETYWQQSIIWRPYKPRYQGRPFELSWTAAGCAQHLLLSGTPLRALWALELEVTWAELQGSLTPCGSAFAHWENHLIWSEYFTEVKGSFDRYLYLCMSSACVCVNRFKA